MPCPSCGGTLHRLIAPGFVECMEVVGGSSSNTPVYARLPASTCGRRYHVGTPTAAPACECGIYAIGTCALCTRPTCGEHGALYGGSLSHHRCAEARRLGAVEAAGVVAANNKAEVERLAPVAFRSFIDSGLPQSKFGHHFKNIRARGIPSVCPDHGAPCVAIDPPRPPAFKMFEGQVQFGRIGGWQIYAPQFGWYSLSPSGEVFEKGDRQFSIMDTPGRLFTARGRDFVNNARDRLRAHDAGLADSETWTSLSAALEGA